MNRLVRLVPKFPNGCTSLRFAEHVCIFRTKWFPSEGRGEREGLAFVGASLSLTGLG
jgi:hypothetical protein